MCVQMDKSRVQTEWVYNSYRDKAMYASGWRVKANEEGVSFSVEIFCSSALLSNDEAHRDRSSQN